MLPARQIVADAENLGKFSVLIEESFVGPGYPDASAVAVHVLVFVVLMAFGVLADVADFLDQVLARAVHLGNNGSDHVLAEQFVLGVAEEGAGESVDERDVSATVHPKNDAVDVLDELAVACLGLAQSGERFGVTRFGGFEGGQRSRARASSC